MAFQPSMKMSFVDTTTGLYYYATQDQSGIWTTALSSDIQYIQNLPQGWNNISIEWDRHPEYWGVFRSQQIGALKYANDGREILNYLYEQQGIQADITLQIWLCQNTESTPGANDFWRYDLAYSSQFDFKTYKDDVQDELLAIATLDSQLFRLLQAYSGTPYNIPFWLFDPTNNTWSTDADAIKYPGIKLRYQANYTSQATPDNPLYYTISPVPPFAPGNNQLAGWNEGAVGDGYHIVPPLAKFSIEANNGATTWIGNDILTPFLIQSNQVPGAANFGSEDNFAGVNHTQPYSRSNNSLNNLLPNTTGTVDMWVSCAAAFGSNEITTSGGGTVTGRYIALCLFEINSNDKPAQYASSGRYVTPGDNDDSGQQCGAMVLKIPLADAPGNNTGLPSFDTSDTPVPLTLKYGKVYVFGLICDIDGGAGSAIYCSFSLDNLQFTLQSRFDSGVSGTAIRGPIFPPNNFLFYRPHQLLSKLASYLPTINTDAYGFPIPITTPITGVSNFLSDSSATPKYDAIPYQVGLTSTYAMQDLGGQSYMNMSIDDLFDFLNKAFQCGLSIENDIDGNQTVLRIENLEYYLNNSVMLLDLGENVYGLDISPLLENLGANMTIGYTKADTNTDFGVDAFCTSIFYDTPLSNIPGTMNFEEDATSTEMYQIEKWRQQQNTQPVSASYDPQSPSRANNTAAIYLNPTDDGHVPIYDPGVPTATPPLPPMNASPIAYVPQLYPNAQSTDATAATTPYIYGLFYPDTAINIPLSPRRNILRNGGLLHSIFDKMDGQACAYRTQGVMQYNNVSLGITGIQTNLEVGVSADVINEFSDLPIIGFDAQLFRPKIISITTQQPVDMYKIINTNPNGYIQFSIVSKYGGTKVYKGFIWKVSQNIGDQSATKFDLLATPDMVF